MWKKIDYSYGFTLIEIVATIAILAVISGVVMISYNKILGNSTNDIYINYENTMKSQTELYFLDNPNAIPSANTSSNIGINILLNNGLLEIKNPDKKGDTCNNSYVRVTRDNDNSHINLSYKVCLICSNYRSKNC